MSDTVILNAHIVNEKRQFEGDIRIREGRIHTIASQLSPLPGETVIDAQGGYILPGMIDDQVHFREPGLTHKGDIMSESAAAVAGGITSFMEMPNTVPPTLDRQALETKYHSARNRAWANYAFYMGASHSNYAALDSIDATSCPGIKIFMGSSTGDMLVDDPKILAHIFRNAHLPIITHCEDTPTIEAQLSAHIARYGQDGLRADMHPDIRSRAACLHSTRYAIDLAKKYQARLHVLHISTADELALFPPGPLVDADGKRCKNITAETCIHFLHFARPDYARLGTRIKCNPAIKELHDKEALIDALNTDVIDILATDHAPHTLAEKNQPYANAPSGLPLVQDALVMAMELVLQGRMQITTLVEKCAHAPARLFDIPDRGFLREGYWADLVLVHPTPHTIERSHVLAKCGWSPFEGQQVQSTIASTWVNGQHVWNGSQLQGSPAGLRLQFAR